ncbi:MAG: hypothetical protein AVDCRST_MAG93-8811 [uncultured Chloroflexia bacterium]|uniref:Uncharacterized protein n=1 Tax=uncultured Chloroflexia bacterium TaxID=1672391 RepID=A0A6J4N8E4_9CHLR|nr:MAG: hypothetical protein AVDCRST_MAG93-8811 [uncultured Chloroflexia bacterium]
MKLTLFIDVATQEELETVLDTIKVFTAGGFTQHKYAWETGSWSYDLDTESWADES